MSQRNAGRENVKNVLLREDCHPNCLFRVDNVKNVYTYVVEFTSNSRKLANFFNSSVKPKTSSITITQSQVVFSPNSSLLLSSSSDEEKSLLSSLLLSPYFFAVFESALKISNKSSHYSID